MVTRQEYLKHGRDHNIHRKYYGQFVTPEMEDIINKHIGMDRLLASTDEHFNDIDLIEWDSLVVTLVDKLYNKVVTDRPTMNVAMGNYKSYTHRFNFNRSPVDELMRSLGDTPSIAGYVCTFKECAKQMVERHGGK